MPTVSFVTCFPLRKPSDEQRCAATVKTPQRSLPILSSSSPSPSPPTPPGQSNINQTQLLTTIQNAVRDNQLGQALQLLTNNPRVQLPEQTVEDLAAKLRTRGLPHQTTLIGHRLKPIASSIQILSKSSTDVDDDLTVQQSPYLHPDYQQGVHIEDDGEIIDDLIQKGFLDKAFKKLSSNNLNQVIRYETIEKLLSLSVSKGQLRKAQYILDRMFPKFGLLPSAQTMNLFITGCGRAGSIRRALSILNSKAFLCLDKSEQSNVCRDLVDACVRCNAVNQANEIIERMKSQNIPITENVYLALLNSSSKSFSFDRSISILQSMKDDGLSPKTLTTYNAILRGASRAGRVQEALKIYHSMIEIPSIVPNIETFNLLLSCCERANDPDRAFKILEMMIEQGDSSTYPTAKSYNYIVAACARVGDIDRALQVSKRMRREGININIVTYNNILEACCNAGRLERAFTLVKHIIQNEGLKPNSHTYNVLIKGCAKWGMINPALRLLSSMKSAGVLPTVITYTVAIDACARAGGPNAIQYAFDVLLQMEQDGIEPNVVTYNSLIHACAVGRNMEIAFQVFYKMIQSDILPDIVTLCSLVDACGRSGNIERAFEIIDQFPKKFQSLSPNVPAYNALMHACSKSDDLQQMETAFKQMQTRDRLRPNVVTYSTLISAYASKNNIDRAMEYLRQMRRNGLRPNRIVFTSIIAAYGRLGNVERAMSMLNETRALYGQPDEELFTSAIVAAVRGGKKHLAKKLSDEMSQAGYFVPTVLNRMMRKIGEVERSGDELKRILDAMQALNIRPQRAALESLISVYSKEADLASAVSVLPDMQRLGYPPNIQTYKKIVQAAAASGKYDDIIQAKELFDMVRSRVKDQDPQLRSHNWVEFYQAIINTVRKLSDVDIGVRFGPSKTALLNALKARMTADCGEEASRVDERRDHHHSKVMPADVSASLDHLG